MSGIPGSWSWKFGRSGWSLEAWGPEDYEDEEVIRVQWQKDGQSKAQPLIIFLRDGEECLESLAKFVGAMRLGLAER
jgi:hypothetical protein